MTSVSRRRLIAATGASLTAAIAGCSSSDDGEGDGDGDDAGENGDDTDPERTETGSETDVGGTVLGEVTIDNLSSASHTVDVIVEYEGEYASWVTETLDADSSMTLEQEWPDEPGSFRVTARLDGDELIETTPSGENGPDCLNLFVRIGGSDDLRFLSTSEGGACGDGEADIEDAE